MEQVQAKETRSKVIQTASILAVLLLFYAALWVLRREIRSNNYQDVIHYLKQIPLHRFLLAFGASLGSYLALTFYDALGLKHIKKSLAYPRMALTSFISYSFSHNIGAAPITGGGIRYRLYSAWGLSAGETANVLVICGMTYWVGFLTMGAVFFFLEPPELPPSIHVPFNSIVSVGVFCALVVTLYLLSTVFLKKTVRVFKWHFPTPALGIALGQMAVGSLDWTCSGAALYLLLPANSLSFPSFLAVYLLAQILGFLSQVPGGLGVLETVVVLLLSPMLPASDVLGALLAFRMVYYLIPLVIGLAAFTFYEIRRNKEGFKRGLQILNRWAPDFAPHVFAFLAFAAGTMLLFSNASPELVRRMNWLNEFLPLGLLEGAHFTTALTAGLLLVLARGLQQRLESAYGVVLVLLGLGFWGCLLKGFDYQEALTLLALFGALLPCRRYFPRKGSPFQQRYPPLWVTAILFVWLGSVWTGIFNYRYEDYSSDLWSTFDLVEDAARFLRSSLGALAAMLVFSVINLFSPAQPETEYPGASQLARALDCLQKKSRRSLAGLSLLGDKALFFNRKSDAFLMYAIEGKSWVVLGDPVGEERDREDLALKFKDLCHRKNAWVLFYLVGQSHFQFYLDMGLTVVKLGEEARVPLKSFKSEGLSGDLKNTYQRLKEKDEYSFGILADGADKSLLPELKRVSEDWLSKNKTREKGFSAGFFHESYLGSFPVALVRREGKVAAFASLLVSGGKEEASVDLLRSSADAPPALEDYLLLEAMLWAKEKGVKHFNLGTAPILDIEGSPLGPFKDRVAEMLSPYANPHRLPDVRKEKERFSPEWVPQYLAASANLPLAVAFTNTQALIARGNRARIKK